MSGAWPLPPGWAAAAGFLASFLLADGWRRLALRRRLLDLPEARRLHQAPTPRGGGIAIVLVLLASAPWLGQGGGLFALGLLLTAGGGFLDDLRPLSPQLKLGLQCLGALPLALAWPLMPEWLGPIGSIAAAWLWVLILVNFWNFMDGSNGLAASQALLVGVALLPLAGLAGPAAWLGLVMAAACLGFLPHNLPRARLFLGDVGSYALGYGVAAGLLMAASTGPASPWQLLLLPSAVLLDAGLTLLHRLVRRRKVWRAHREHLYQRAITHGCSHVRVCAAYAIWTVVVIALALLLGKAGTVFHLFALMVVVLVGIALYWRTGRHWPVVSPDETESVG